jgi:hypothetical protein
MMDRDNFNRNHPELRPGEVFLTNDNAPGFETISWKTKRLGRQAYNMKGELTWGLPVFVQATELEAAGITPFCGYPSTMQPLK